VRWGKGERGGVASSGRTDAAPDALTRLEKATEAPGARGREWNQLGVAYRQAGRFADARKAYDRAIELDAKLAGELKEQPPAVTVDAMALLIEQIRAGFKPEGEA
jgi:tetratricopeptide (TPR) repeat protein